MDWNASLNGRPSRTAVGNIQMTFVTARNVKNRTNRGTWNGARTAPIAPAEDRKAAVVTDFTAVAEPS